MQDGRGTKSVAVYTAVFVLALAAVGVSAYLSWLAIRSGQSALGCDNTSFDCDLVLGSRWSVWLGIPVSMLGLCTYVTICAATLAATLAHSNRLRKTAWAILSAAAMAASGAAIWFIALQAFDLQAFCPYCLAVHTLGITLTVVLIAVTWQRPRTSAERVDPAAVLLGQARPSKASSAMSNSARSGLRWPGVVAGGCGVALLIAGQIVLPPQTYTVEEFAAVDAGGEVSEDVSQLDDAGARRTSVTGEADEKPSWSFETAPEPGQAELESGKPDAASPTDTIQVAVSPNSSTTQPPLPESKSGNDRSMESSPATAHEPDTDNPKTNASVADVEDILEKKKSEQELDEDWKKFFEPGETTSTVTKKEPVAPTKPSTGSNRQLIRFLNGRIALDLDEHMILGSRGAPYLIAEMFDYACPHCRRTHGHIKQAQRRYGDQLAIVLIPVPMSAECNRFMRSTKKGHRESCQYARLADAVWKARPDRLAEFHEFMFTGSVAPDIKEARSLATRLVGEDALAAALSDFSYEWRHKVRIDAYGICGLGKIPKLMIGDKVVSGGILYPDNLYDLLEDNLGIEALDQ